MADTQPSTNEPSEQRKVILIVEDDEAIGTFLLQVLQEEEGYQAFLSTNGAQAFEQIKTLTPDLFLLDYRLPDITGLEIADRLRTLDPFKHRPVMVISAYASSQELLKRQIPFLAKPFELDILLQMVKTLLKTSRHPPELT